MKKGQKIKLLTNVGKLKKNEIVTVTGVDYALRMAFIKNDKGISESVDNNFSNYQLMNDSKERLKTYKIKNHDSGKTYRVKATSYTDAKDKYEKFIGNGNSFTYKGHVIIKSSYGWKVKIGNKIIEFATDKEAKEYIDLHKDSSITEDAETYLGFKLYKNGTDWEVESPNGVQWNYDGSMSLQEVKKAIDKGLRIGNWNDTFTEDAYVYPTNASTLMAYSFAKRCVEKFGGKVAAKNGYKYVYVAPDKNTAEKAKTFLETNYSSILPSVKFIVGDSLTEDEQVIKDSRSLKTYKIKNADSGKTYRVKATSYTDAKDKYNKYILKDSFTEDADLTIGYSFTNPKDATLYTVVKFKKMSNNSYIALLKSRQGKYFLVNDLNHNDYGTKFTSSRHFGHDVDYALKMFTAYTTDSLTEDGWSSYTFKTGRRSDAFKQYLRDRSIYFEASQDREYTHFEVKNADKAVDRRANEIIRQLKDSLTEDADIAQTDIKSTYLPEDANADNIQYLGFNEKRKLSFYGYGDRYFVHYDLEGRTEEVDKETVQKILKKNILGEIDENDLINKEPQSEEIVSDSFDWTIKQERGDK